VKTNFVLIDFENVQPKDLASLRGFPFQIFIFCGANQSKISLVLADELQQLGPQAKYIRIQGTGKNALDFHIAYYIGLLSAQNPDAGFYIISRDKGFEPLIKHLEVQNVPCRVVPSLAGVLSCLSPCTDRTQKVTNRLLTIAEGRPRKLRALKTFIKAQLNREATDEVLAEVIARLTQAGMSADSEGKLTWPPS